YEPQAKLTNKKVKWLQTDASANWKISPEIMAEQIQENDGNCVLILNYPSNPLGVTYTESELKAIVSFCKQQGILIISDEIYGEVTHSQPHHTMAKFYPEGTIVSGGLSKWAGAGGWRLGYFVMPKALKTIADAMAVIASETFTSVSAPIQYAAVEAFKENTALEVYIQHSKKILETVANYTYQELKTAGVEMPAPEGGFYLFPTFNKWLPALKQKGINNSETFCKVLLEESGVALLPGNVFGHRNTSISARLSYVDFDGKQLLDVLEANPNKQLGADFVKQNCPRIVNGIKSLITWLENL
ncbi:MAG: pyridoxal phosphate-dependent aminotransferase, partial [Flavobacteriaceae bacterium]|nr:pyridoxal phosphate-dependent aminotransferase [Flavobacteriaceae bacterium]